MEGANMNAGDEPSGPTCENLQTCRAIAHHVLGGLACLDPQHDRCFCVACTDRRGERDETYTRGAYPYVLPSGCVKLGVKVMPGNEGNMRGLYSWAPCFHASSLSAVKEILESPDHTPRFVPPGTFMYDGRRVGIRKGSIQKPFVRWNMHAKQEEFFDPEQCFFSPSMRMCESGCYTRLEEVQVHPLLAKVKIQVALQVWLMPDTFGIGQQTTTRSTERICPVIPNECLEYYTKRSGTHFISGVIIRIRDSGRLSMAVPERGVVWQRPPVGVVEPKPEPESGWKPPWYRPTYRDDPAGVARERREDAGKQEGGFLYLLGGLGVITVAGAVGYLIGSLNGGESNKTKKG
eukprot:TRINITY_DN378_c0_g2_i1.p1 TRINITY_DN378_c0_g2~~TRINITY_DN378_c0_g2_i1.p1  ORF type:complete len:402 (+),score=59.63 TRINITY_DN378_c0_g2_i1:163-1206(+)